MNASWRRASNDPELLPYGDPQSAQAQRLFLHQHRRAGARSDLYDPHPSIYPERVLLQYLYLKFGDGDLDDTVAFVERTWDELLPQRPFDFIFMEDQLNEFLYNREQQLGRMFSVFAILAIAVACLGLFGLIAFMTEQRTKEIGIRKVLAASVSDIVVLMSKDFLLLVVVGNLVACPIAFFGMRQWLQDFAYHVDLGVGHVPAWVSSNADSRRDHGERPSL